MNVALARLVLLGFESVEESLRLEPAQPSERMRRRTVEAGVLVAGVDGYRKGWVAVSLDPSGDVQVSTHATFSEVLSLRARVIAVDIPIDPPGLGGRVLLAEAGIRPPGAFPGVPEADLLDAAVGAWTAARYSAQLAEPVPAAHEGRLGAIWR
jgi:predicted RNase H-like nuclease